MKRNLFMTLSVVAALVDGIVRDCVKDDPGRAGNGICLHPAWRPRDDPAGAERYHALRRTRVTAGIAAPVLTGRKLHRVIGKQAPADCGACFLFVPACRPAKWIR